MESESESRSVVSDSVWPHGLYGPWNSPGQNTGAGSLSFLQGIFPTQGSNSGLLHCRWILCQLSHQGNPQGSISSVQSLSCVRLFATPWDYTVHGTLQARIPEWIAIPFSRGSSQSRDRTQVSCIAGGFFTSWATRETQEYWNG